MPFHAHGPSADDVATAVLRAEVTRDPAVIDPQAFEGVMALTARPNPAAILAERLRHRVGPA